MAPPTPPSAAGCSVRVAVRVRPLLSFEKTERLGECLRCLPKSKQLCVGDGGDNGRNTFTFDFTFPKASEQRMLYDDCVASLLEGGLVGSNGRRLFLTTKPCLCAVGCSADCCCLLDFWLIVLCWFLFPENAVRAILSSDGICVREAIVRF